LIYDHDDDILLLFGTGLRFGKVDADVEQLAGVYFECFGDFKECYELGVAGSFILGEVTVIEIGVLGDVE
jgi:hypothetical protein